ncbi:hypothetical protein KIPB_005295 [Kipferlia bialata]|uniref:CS domain-containing protein n=1 Tax=Kipferlia bialata TaxID=797122 RepID=A0A9K3GH78_9EUKA|nr:hypothetical protein KIPB_005295 [Kipferlia bialata]|eukprot:g5295.t1
MMKPTIRWAQDDDYLFLTIEVANCTNPTINVTETVLSFKHGEYECELTLGDEVVPSESSWDVRGLGVEVKLAKKEPEHWDRLAGDDLRRNWIKVDWDKYEDSDASEPEQNQFDPSQFGQGQNFGGMPGMEGMGGMGGMPGMEGMGGMGGMPGMEGMGDMDLQSLMAQMGGKDGQMPDLSALQGMEGMPDLSALQGMGGAPADEEGSDDEPIPGMD